MTIITTSPSGADEDREPFGDARSHGEPEAAGQEHTAPARAAGTQGGDGWVRFTLSLLARCYLTMTATLAVIALLPLLLGWQPLVILSGSMEPTISPGDVVLVSAPPEGEDYGAGTVVAFEAAAPGDRTIVKVHRITEVGDDGYVTQGDANNDADSGLLAREDIVGGGRLLVPFVGAPVYWMKEDPLALAAWLLGTLVALALAVSPAPGSSRRGTAAVAGLALLAVVAGAASPSVHGHAAFTARTDTAASWSTAVQPTITPGRAGSFSLLAAGSVSDSLLALSDVAGNIGTTPGTVIYGFSVFERNGSLERNTTAARNAMTDAGALATALQARTATPISGALSGRVAPGVYSANALTLSGNITLDAAGDPSARFVFTANSLSTAARTSVSLAGGASAANVYWRITGEANLSSGTTLRGTLLADRDVNGGDVAVVGRIVSLNGSISVTRIVVNAP